MVGFKLDCLEAVAEERTTKKLLAILDDISHPLHTAISNQRSSFSDRLLLPRCRTNRLMNSFVHRAITLHSIALGGRRGGSRRCTVDKGK